MNRKARPSPSTPPSGQVRIIGGRWRGSKLPVPAVAGLRPTADRVRETLFNWLQGELAGARVLDLFAGSGALGLEAASRGAVCVDLVEAAPQAAEALEQTSGRLAAGGGAGELRVHARTAADFLAVAKGEGRQWDIVFIDPPFAADLWRGAFEGLVPCLAPRAWIYVESPLAMPPPVPAGARPHRELATREARAVLYKVGMD